MRSHLGDEQAEMLFEGLNQPPTISVRFNPRKLAGLTLNREALGDPVPWCPDAYYLEGRRAFTFDPFFHAGAYYVQDASSMYLSTMLGKWLSNKDCNPSAFPLNPSPITALDLCAAPGGKSTLLASLLPEGSLLISNEPIRKRTQVLVENMQKWGSPAADGRAGMAVRNVVTQNYPEEFRHFRETFDLILADVPCSGEGMFRKDETAIREWSLDNVRQCAERQQKILSSIIPTLKEGGLLIYSTCTFNRFEDEDQVQWLVSEYVMTLLEQRHFFPGRDRGEGLYMAALRMPGNTGTGMGNKEMKSLKTLRVMPAELVIDPDAPVVELDYQQSIAYLRREALHIAAPRGVVTVTHRGLPLGPAKSVGNRLNNLYPQEWRIRTTHSPSEPLPDLFV